MTGDDLDRLAAEHVLGLLEGADVAQAERLVATDPDFEARVLRWQAHFADLDGTASLETPPAGLWRQIEADLAAAATAPAPVAAGPSPAAPVIIPDPRSAFRALWHNLAFWRVAGLASAAAALLLGIGVAWLAGQPARTPVLVAVLIAEGTSRPAAVVNTFADGRTEFVPLDPIPVPPDRALEIWTLWDRSVGPRSVGVIDQARSVRLNVENLPKAPNQLFEITLEPKTGSPTGRPTGPVLMKGTTSTTL